MLGGLGGFALVPEGEGLLRSDFGGGELVGGAEVGDRGEGGAELVGGKGVGGLSGQAFEVVDGGCGGGEGGRGVVGGGAAGGEGGLRGDLAGGEAGEEGRDRRCLGRGHGGGGAALRETLEHGQVLAVACGGRFGIVELRLHSGSGGGGGVGWARIHGGVCFCRLVDTETTIASERVRPDRKLPSYRGQGQCGTGDW